MKQFIMSKLSFIWLLLLLVNIECIGQYNFNACRIANCNAEELNCISEEQDCLNMFSTMRTCLATCKGMQQNFNPCWVKCKNSSARTNNNWLSLSLCYQNVCYLSNPWLTLSILLVVLLYVL